MRSARPLAAMGFQFEFLEDSASLLGIPACRFPRVRAGEDFDFAAIAVIIEPLDAPVSGMLPILEYLCCLRHVTS